MCLLSCNNLKMGSIWTTRRIKSVSVPLYILTVLSQVLQSIFLLTVSFCRVEDSDEEDRSPRSDDNLSYSNPIRDDPDLKAKLSEMNEEKRSKLREIEVVCSYQLILLMLGWFSLFHWIYFCFSNRLKSWSSRMNWNLGKDPRNLVRVFRSRWSIIETNYYRRYEWFYHCWYLITLDNRVNFILFYFFRKRRKKN